MSDNRTTELLCKLLDERGITWKKRRGYIRWSKRTVHGITHYQAWPCHDGTVTLTIHDEYALTPEQAIAATLGEEKAGKKSPPKGGPGPCGQPSDDIIHDAVTLGGGECKNESKDGFRCSKCGDAWLGGFNLGPIAFKRCPSCGAKVMNA